MYWPVDGIMYWPVRGTAEEILFRSVNVNLDPALFNAVEIAFSYGHYGFPHPGLRHYLEIVS